MSRLKPPEWSRRLRRSRGVVALAAVSLLLTTISPMIPRWRLLVINTSPSVAPGLYWRCWDRPAVGRLVDFCIPPAARPYIYGRSGNSGVNWYILKPIAAGPGDYVDTTGPWLVINGHRIAPMPPSRDSAGRRLPIWRSRCVLRAGEFFVFSNRIPTSFDSRCYGPIREEQIAAVRRALITW